MSRIGNKPINVPDGVEVKVDGHHVTVKGPKGTLERDVHKNMTVTLNDKVITVTRPDDEPENRSLHGLTRTLINNMIEGVLHEYKRDLEINGVGYRAQKKGNKLVMNLGYSHPVEIEGEEGVTIETPSNTKIVVSGISKERVGQVAAQIREVRKPEPYKGKGIKYVDERIIRKEGKTAGKK